MTSPAHVLPEQSVGPEPGADDADESYSDLLARIHRRFGARRLFTGPWGHAICPAATFQNVQTFGIPGPAGVQWLPRSKAAVADITPRHLRSQGLLAVVATPVTVRPHVDRPRIVGARGSALDPHLAWAQALCGSHIAVIARALAAAMSHLAGRTSDGSPLLNRQLAQATIADTAMDIAEARESLASSVDVQQVHEIHSRMVSSGRAVIRLLGARGFLQEGPGGALYAAELCCRVYLVEVAA